MVRAIVLGFFGSVFYGISDSLKGYVSGDMANFRGFLVFVGMFLLFLGITSAINSLRKRGADENAKE